MSNGFNYRCPRCKDTHRLDILAEVWVRVTDSGTDADASGDGSCYWSLDSDIICRACGYAAKVHDFEPLPE
jgi:hypothetical protein